MPTWSMPNAPLCYQPVLQGDPPLSAGGRWGTTGTELLEPKWLRVLTQLLEPKRQLLLLLLPLPLPLLLLLLLLLMLLLLLLLLLLLNSFNS